MSSFSRGAPRVAERVALPRPPENSPPHTFPWLATIAPVIGSVALWAITDSIYALIFAALGPLIAVASVGDAQVGARRTRRLQRARFERDCERTRRAIAEAHLRERSALATTAPGARVLLASALPDPERWRGSFSSPIRVRLGEGPVASSVVVEDETMIDADDEVLAHRERLRSLAAFVDSAPVVIDARLGIGFYGPTPLAVAAARAIVIQLAAALSPSGARIDGPWGWLAQLPHDQTVGDGRLISDAIPPSGAWQLSGASQLSGAPLLSGTSPRPGAEYVVFHDAAGTSPPLVVAIAHTAMQLPRDARVVVSVGAAGSVVTKHPDPTACGSLLSDYVSEREAELWARAQTVSAREEGIASPLANLPDRVGLHALLDHAATAHPALECALGVGPGGPVVVDLLHDGPHAIVGGTTGSGKSELLISWVVSMAATRAPAAVSFLFVDFKGGAAFEPLRQLPHSVGMITDLDTHQALRALSSLRAEVRRRERVLAAAGARSIDEFGENSPLARLVIVVDEYAAMLDDHPGLHGVFVDLAARGRSLGVHLVLCTQRPGGVVRESILANAGLRLCLRVNNAPDSINVIGSDAAALLPATPRGRALVRSHGGAVQPVQVALTVASDIAAVTKRWASHPRAQAPWCAPLPTAVSIADLGARALEMTVPFALVDFPEEQRQDVARFDPDRHGNLLVVGAGGAGKTALLDALATAPTRVRVTRVFPSLPAVWDAIHDALDDEPETGERPRRVLLLDDIDAIVLGCPDEYTAALVEMLTRLLREGPGRGVTTVLTAQRLPGSLHGLGALCGSAVLLRLPSRQEHLLAGGHSEDWQADFPPGAGIWRGNRIQVALADAVPHLRAASAVVAVPTPGVPLAVVSTRPREFATLLRASAPNRPLVDVGRTADSPDLFAFREGDPGILIADADAWMSRWGALGTLRETTELLFDGCSIGEFRALTGLRDIPPPHARGQRPLWLVRRDGSVHRARLDAHAARGRAIPTPSSAPSGDGRRVVPNQPRSRV
ncbi:S-DNA-T family DNA segregation ATPase FtsK/SpoIIIE [Glaciihabitans tibetensis]|uniref:S-DNA-T family DNA segregation ATPase FtsK/SpoIIIE n=1 Tax=Glaciihabitans tibetensis TaxID=1266600 RepID=A0A2T0VHS3_9MICO|nr:FtsK/SpoIIIE domain-containing protein [Glaciihabitans tibetensis]PRY69623.1 S-DNA-T family DNA segregation ATPase FtsK/SpoIIIE [Glaciihabitans tibetensis]